MENYIKRGSNEIHEILMSIALGLFSYLQRRSYQSNGTKSKLGNLKINGTLPFEQNKHCTCFCKK